MDDAICRVHASLPGDGLITLAWGLRGPEDTGMDALARELKLAAELGLRTSLHSGSDGTQRPIADLHEHGLLREHTTFVHGNGISDEELRMLADAGSSLSISPDVELKMDFGNPLTGRALSAGLRPTLSVDDVPSVGGDMFSTMRTAFAVQRGLNGGLNSRDVLEFTTIDAAASCGLDGRTGSIPPARTPTSSCCAPTTSPCSRSPTRLAPSSRQTRVVRRCGGGSGDAVLRAVRRTNPRPGPPGRVNTSDAAGARPGNCLTPNGAVVDSG
ncbi:amidohydrolase family protein [Streptomyces sp. NPDC058466]|uniref:amidohydrolase family protein n=1 Tax=Streptomyces sp. NPDC058466 TaxID=3346512 RepID=UPI00365DB9BD